MRQLVVVGIALLLGAAASRAAIGQEVHNLAIRIENWSDNTLRYQIGRATGPTWSQVFELEPEMAHQWGPVAPGENPALATLISRYTPGELFVRYPLYDGLHMQKLRTTNPRSADPAARRRAVRVFWYLEDRNGNGALYVRPEPSAHQIEAASPDELKTWYERERQDLVAQIHDPRDVPDETPESIRQRIFELRSNHAYTSQ